MNSNLQASWGEQDVKGINNLDQAVNTIIANINKEILPFINQTNEGMKYLSKQSEVSRAEYENIIARLNRIESTLFDIKAMTRTR